MAVGRPDGLPRHPVADRAAEASSVPRRRLGHVALLSSLHDLLPWPQQTTTLGRPMSDISIVFPWYSYPLLIAMIGWPGLLIGLVLGALLWQRHWIWGGLLGGIAGCLLWAVVY